MAVSGRSEVNKPALEFSVTRKRDGSPDAGGSLSYVQQIAEIGNRAAEMGDARIAVMLATFADLLTAALRNPPPGQRP
jgi:hypothetical protein